MERLSLLSLKLQKIEKKAERRSKLLGVIGSSVLFAELAIVTVGTFSIYSWDIMEPISYIMISGNFVFSFGWFVAYLDNKQLQDPINWFK